MANDDVIKQSEGVLKMANKRVELGDLVRDTITGFEGIAVKRQESIGYTQSQIGVQPTRLGDDGFPMDEYWFSEERLEVIKRG